MSENDLYYTDGQVFPGTILPSATESRPAWPRVARPAEGAPTVVTVVLDDVGFGQLGCFGGLGGRIRTPQIDRLAGAGLRYNNFHVSPMCAPTRAALLTGRNNHSVGVGSLMELTTGFPGYNGRIPKETAMLPALLASGGYASAAIGKWHLTPADEITPIGPFDRWPLGQGFQRFYGFLNAVSDQWDPLVWRDNHCVGRPASDVPGYHLSDDLADHAISWMREHDAVAPNRPFLLYVAFGATHQPHQVAEEWIEPYRGAFAAGWEVVRQETLEAQQELGIVPDDTVLPPPNYGVPDWDDIDRETRQLLERQMEVYAGFLSHTDHQVGRLVAELDRHDRLDDTFLTVLSDNGASGEGGPYGQFTMTSRLNNAEVSADDKASWLKRWGGPDSYANYATGWAMAGNTPNRWYKQFTHEGGTRAPLVVHWPAGIGTPGSIRPQFHAAPDVVPTILEVTGTDMPSQVQGVPQRPLEGSSFAYTLNDASTPTRKVTQYFEMFGHRAIWAQGWKAVCEHWTNDNQRLFLGEVEHDLPYGDLARDKWELYHLDSDFSESRDVAADHPDRLNWLINLWWSEAGRYQVLPVEDASAGRIAQGAGRPTASRTFEQRDVYRYYGPIELSQFVSPGLRRRPHVITATIEPGEGVLVSEGGPEGGYSLCIVDGELRYVMNYLGTEVGIVRAGPVPQRRCAVMAAIRPQGEREMAVTLAIDGVDATTATVVHANPVRYDMRRGGMRVGSDPVGVWTGYQRPFAFTGVLDEVVITCDGQEKRDPAAELRIARAEQ